MKGIQGGMKGRGFFQMILNNFNSHSYISHISKSFFFDFPDDVHNFDAYLICTILS